MLRLIMHSEGAEPEPYAHPRPLHQQQPWMPSKHGQAGTTATQAPG